MQEQKTQLLGNAQRILRQVRKVVVGKNNILTWVFASILAKGHILIEDIPGVGKTTMALAFARTLGLKDSRVQFTPDILPSDITGFSVLDQATGKMSYRPGAVLCNLFLADELNRATSRTQSALLEAMEEGQVTVDGISHKIPQPFIVIATQNPTGAAGTQPLPDSQTDRFMIRLSLGYPALEDEIGMLPIYIGVPGEEQQGLCTGSENYWCINRHAAPEDIEATKAFLEWLITSEEGKRLLTVEMGFVTPFDTMEADMDSMNALQRAAQESLMQGRWPVSWAFTTIPSETWKNRLGAAMLEYAQGTGDWNAVRTAFVDGWADEQSRAE